MDLRPHELQAFIRQFEPLANVEVAYESDIKRELAPHVCLIRGVVMVRGEPHVWSAEVNLTHFQSSDDLLKLVEAIFLAMGKAEVD